jgi:6-pyruvoyltetrahydropterin/6-carboxytetrahydropterin synthase
MEKLVYATRRERFNAAHKLWHDEWDEQKNFETFGKCSNPNWHGHNYELFITVKGVPNEITGYCMDLKYLSTIVKTQVINKLDHKNLNMDVEFMRGMKTSTENVAIAIWEQLEELVNEKGCQLHCIKVTETENQYVEYYGGK